MATRRPDEPPEVPGAWTTGPGRPEVREWLAGPRSRRSELARLGRIFAEFLRGFRALHFLGPCVTVFGSARVGEGEPHYRMARELGRRMAELGYTVMTGGGPGIMEAANRGAREGAAARSGATSSCRTSSARTRTSTGSSPSGTSSCGR